MHKRILSRGLAVLAGLGVCTALSGTPAVASEPVTWRWLNGIEATVYPPEYILENMTLRQGDETLLVVDDVYYALVTDIDDPIIANRGDGSFHPMGLDAVSAALRDIQIEDAQLQVRIFVLPFPRREVMDSSARDDVIMLSPGVREVPDYHVHFTVVHEVGHTFQYRWMPDADTEMWRHYSRMRGIEDPLVYHAAAIHKNRPHEIFAEDFRFLFGGALAVTSGSIENEALLLPGDIDGLQDFLAALPRASRAALPPRLFPTPNPFNPSTEISVQFSDDPGSRPMLLRIFDAQGNLVRRLWEGVVGSREMRVRWDGHADGGQAASSGVYFARADFAGTASTAKLMLLK
jgi:hypothetical protein